jgi:hypothetical protein
MTDTTADRVATDVFFDRTVTVTVTHGSEWAHITVRSQKDPAISFTVPVQVAHLPRPCFDELCKGDDE